jgi:hypothetical protein
MTLISWSYPPECLTKHTLEALIMQNQQKSGRCGNDCNKLLHKYLPSIAVQIQDDCSSKSCHGGAGTTGTTNKKDTKNLAPTLPGKGC